MSLPLQQRSLIELSGVSVRRKTVRTLLVALILVAAPLAACSSTPPCEQDTTAFVMSQEFVKRQLRSPSTADFPLINASGVSVSRFTNDDGRCAFTVRGYVDAQNGFGATVRQNYTVMLAPDSNGTDWSLLGITM